MDFRPNITFEVIKKVAFGGTYFQRKNLMVVMMVEICRDKLKINSRFDNYSVSSKIRQTLLHWLSYYWLNRQELLQKAKGKYDNGGKEKAAKYYKDNKDVLKEKAKNKYKHLSEEEKEAKRQYSKNRYNKMKEK